MDDPNANRTKAEQLHLHATQRYIRLNAHIKVYRSRNEQTEQLARNGIEFIEAALTLFPDDPNYLNTYALLLADGLGQKQPALNVLQRASQLAPDNIQIRQNTRDLQAGGLAPRALSPGIVIAVIAAVLIIIFVIVSVVSQP